MLRYILLSVCLFLFATDVLAAKHKLKVLVAYDQWALSEMKGEPQTFIQDRILALNDIYANSGVPIQLILAKTMPISQTAVNPAALLNYTRTYPGINYTKSAYKADLVVTLMDTRTGGVIASQNAGGSFLDLNTQWVQNGSNFELKVNSNTLVATKVNNGSSCTLVDADDDDVYTTSGDCNEYTVTVKGLCGVAYRPPQMNINLAYSIAGADCGSWAIAHEIGHNLGLAHDIIESPKGGKYSYGRGHGVDGEFFTIMAYSTSFPGATMSELFSDPDNFQCKGNACGVAAGQANEADSVRAINNVIGDVGLLLAEKNYTTYYKPNCAWSTPISYAGYSFSGYSCGGAVILQKATNPSGACSINLVGSKKTDYTLSAYNCDHYTLHRKFWPN